VVLLPLRLGFAVAWVWSYLSMRQSVEARFDLNLSGIMTFFFTVFYLQYHMTSIAKGEHCPYRPGLYLSAGRLLCPVISRPSPSASTVTK
jgi:hypothetical protein